MASLQKLSLNLNLGNGGLLVGRNANAQSCDALLREWSVEHAPRVQLKRGRGTIRLVVFLFSLFFPFPSRALWRGRQYLGQVVGCAKDAAKVHVLPKDHRCRIRLEDDRHGVVDGVEQIHALTLAWKKTKWSGNALMHVRPTPAPFHFFPPLLPCFFLLLPSFACPATERVGRGFGHIGWQGGHRAHGRQPCNRPSGPRSHSRKHEPC